MNRILHKNARAELREAGRWYFERNPSAAARFSKSVEGVIDRIMLAPRQFPKLEAEFRSALVPGFPYHIIFRTVDDAIEIVAIAHASREPGYWRERL